MIYNATKMNNGQNRIQRASLIRLHNSKGCCARGLYGGIEKLLLDAAAYRIAEDMISIDT